MSFRSHKNTAESHLWSEDADNCSSNNNNGGIHRKWGRERDSDGLDAASQAAAANEESVRRILRSTNLHQQEEQSHNDGAANIANRNGTATGSPSASTQLSLHLAAHQRLYRAPASSSFNGKKQQQEPRKTKIKQSQQEQQQQDTGAAIFCSSAGASRNTKINRNSRAGREGAVDPQEAAPDPVTDSMWADAEQEVNKKIHASKGTSGKAKAYTTTSSSNSSSLSTRWGSPYTARSRQRQQPAAMSPAAARAAQLNALMKQQLYSER